MAYGEGIVVAVGGELAVFEGGEIVFFGVDGLEELVAALARITGLTVDGGIVVADHVYIKEVSDLCEGYDGVVDESRGSA